MSGDIAISSTHPIFANVDHLFQSNGNDVLDILATDPQGQVLTSQSGHGLYAVWAGSGSGDFFAVVENSPVGTLVTTVAASDPDAGDTLTYAITVGNLDPDGDARVSPSPSTPRLGRSPSTTRGDLDYETTSAFNLAVTVTDANGLSDSADMRITLTNLDEPGNERPEIPDAAFTLPELSPVGTAHRHPHRHRHRRRRHPDLSPSPPATPTPTPTVRTPSPSTPPPAR